MVQWRPGNWQKFLFRGIRNAWGVTLDAQAVALICLGRQAAGSVRVQGAMHLSPPTWMEDAEHHHDWLVQTLREASGHEARRHRRLVLALPAERCRSGELDWYTGQGDQALQAEVQLEAAEAFGVSPEDISFDYEVRMTDARGLQKVSWLACQRGEVHEWRKHTRAAGWRLPAVESDEQAAHRAASALLGGVKSLLAQPHQDWQFSLQEAEGAQASSEIEDALAQMRGSPAWPWLSACGAGLRAFS